MLGLLPHRIVVGVQPLADCDAALEYAARQAVIRDCGVHLVIAEPTTLDASDDEPGVAGEDLSRLDRDHLTRCEQRLEQWTSGAVPVSSEVAHGAVVPALCRSAPRAELVVLQHHGGDGARLRSGSSVALAVSAGCDVPVVAVPAGWHDPRGPRPVVAGVLHADASWSVVTAAFEEAERVGAAVRVVRAWTPLDQPDPADPHVRAVTDRLHAALVRERLEDDFSVIASAHPTVPWEVVAVGGRAAQVLAAESTRARLLVLGRQWPQHSAGLPPGRVTRTVLAFAQCPVLVAAPTLRRLTTRGATRRERHVSP